MARPKREVVLSNEDYIRTYKCVDDASKDLGIDRSDIYKALRGERKQVGGYKAAWKTS